MGSCEPREPASDGAVSLTLGRGEARLVLAIVNIAEGQGYGGMALYETARKELQEAIARHDGDRTKANSGSIGEHEPESINGKMREALKKIRDELRASDDWSTAVEAEAVLRQILDYCSPIARAALAAADASPKTDQIKGNALAETEVDALAQRLAEAIPYPRPSSPLPQERGAVMTRPNFIRSRLSEAEVSALREDAARLNFVEFSKANRARCESPQGFNHALNSWSASDWMTATMGELGEAANIVKKLNRYRDGIIGNKEAEDVLRDKLRREIGDTFGYLDLMAQLLGFNIGDAAAEVFDRKSEEIGYPIRLRAAALSPKSEPGEEEGS